jgi:hypothetical protein
LQTGGRLFAPFFKKNNLKIHGKEKKEEEEEVNFLLIRAHKTSTYDLCARLFFLINLLILKHEN